MASAYACKLHAALDGLACSLPQRRQHGVRRIAGQRDAARTPDGLHVAPGTGLARRADILTKTRGNLAPYTPCTDTPGLPGLTGAGGRLHSSPVAVVLGSEAERSSWMGLPHPLHSACVWSPKGHMRC